MKRSEINQLIRDASACFAVHGWTLPPNPRWDVTDFGLGDWRQFGLVLVNLAEETEYCEKLMYAKRGMATPSHHHARKKEDIICRWGLLQVRLSPPSSFSTRVQATGSGVSPPSSFSSWGPASGGGVSPPSSFSSWGPASGGGESTTRENEEGGRGVEICRVKINGEPADFQGTTIIALSAGERITLEPGAIHTFEPLSEECIIGEVSTANDDVHDNFFTDPHVGRYPGIEEDEEPIVRLVAHG